MEALKEQLFTTDYIYSLSEGKRAELIDGIVYDLAAPSGTHQRISMFLSSSIYNYIQTREGDCSVFAAPYAVFLDNNDYTCVEPDISVICEKNKMDEKGCHGAPDWIIEIVSPATRRMDYMIKLFKYKSAGVKEYWIVDPEEKAVKVYNFAAQEYGDYSFTDSVPVGIYTGFEISLQSENK